METKQTNGTFRILSALAIIFVVAGHADFSVFDIGGYSLLFFSCGGISFYFRLLL